MTDSQSGATYADQSFSLTMAWTGYQVAVASGATRRLCQVKLSSTTGLLWADDVGFSCAGAVAPLQVVKYYRCGGLSSGGGPVAMRENGTVYWLLTDHLGSTALTLQSDGSVYGELRYYPYGKTRYGSGTTPTSHRFTGQLEESALGLYDYGARFYDPLLGRFISADTMVPGAGNPQNLNRYSYVRNNPLRYTDPSGHSLIESEEDGPRTLLFEEIEIILHTDEPGYPNQNKFNRQIWFAAKEAGISPMLVKAVVAAESGFNPHEVSSSGAVGLMQLKPDTASDVADPFKNLKAGAKWLRRQYDNFKGATTSEDRWKLAATAYTAGEGTVQYAQGIVRDAPTDSPWHGRDPHTFGGLTGTDATNQSPLSVAAEKKLEYSQKRAIQYVNRDIADYIHDIGHWLRGMTP